MTLLTPASLTKPKRRGTFVAPSSGPWDTYTQPDAVERAIAFIEGECIVPSGRGAGRPYHLRVWQRDLLAEVLDPEVVTAVVSAPRGFTKSGLMAALGVWGLFDLWSAQVLAISTGMRTAGIVYGRAQTIIEANKRLLDHAVPHLNTAEPFIELPDRRASIRPLPAEEANIVGWSPSLVLVDELGYVTAPVWEVMQTSLGKVEGSRLIAMGTPGLSSVEGVMFPTRVSAFGPTPPKRLRYIEHAADPGADPGDPETWKSANPALGDLVGIREVEHDYETMPAARFAQMRLGLWAQGEDAWVPVAVWDGLDVVPGDIPEGSSITLGFDGSVSRDATALVAYEPERSRLVTLGVWEPSKGQQVPRAAVLAAIEEAFATYDVRRFLGDPWHWRTELQQLARDHGTEVVLEFNTAAISRMGPATDALATAIRTRAVSTDGNEVLRRHAVSAIARMTASGQVLVKDVRHPQRIDALTAAVLAHEAWRTLDPEPTGSYAIW